MRFITIVNLALLIGLAELLGSCKSEQEKVREVEQLTTAPLEFDPTEKYELSRWWSNGHELLRLDDNAAYAVYPEMNRYARPLERGRWSQQSYAVLWLEPYTKIRPEPKRVSIGKLDGKIALQLPKLEPMFPIAKPPSVVEDRLIGTWDGVGLGELELRSDMRYTLSSADGASPLQGMPAVRGGQSGRWSVSNHELILSPDAPDVQPLRLQLNVTDKDATIEGPGGAMRKSLG